MEASLKRRIGTPLATKADGDAYMIYVTKKHCVGVVDQMGIVIRRDICIGLLVSTVFPYSESKETTHSECSCLETGECSHFWSLSGVRTGSLPGRNLPRIPRAAANRKGLSAGRKAP